MVKIFSDSTSDLSDEIIKKYNIGIIPLYIILSDREYRDGIDITPDKIYSWAESTHLSPKTSAPSPADVMEYIEPYIERGEDVIIFSISEEMSTTYNVLSMISEEYGGKVKVIDSRSLSTGVGHLVIKAAEMALSGHCCQEITEHIEKIIPKVRASFVVDTLDYLYRGGRCSGLSAMAGGMLKLHPKIVVKDGKMIPSKKFRGDIARAAMEYVKDMRPELEKAEPSRVFITHSGCDDMILLNLYSFLESLGRFDEILITRAGGVISSHCGPGTVGVIYIDGE